MAESNVATAAGSAPAPTQASAPAQVQQSAGSGLQNFNLGQLAASPGVRQLAALFGVALAVAVGVTIFMWSQKPAMQTLYAGLSDRDNAEIVEALNTAGIEHKQSPADGSVMVAAADVNRARMALASEGLPRSAGGGFELMREEQGIGVSQFLENARYQHALETELSRTISQLQPVRSARVHLAMPKRSAFARARQNASASVLVALYPGRRLENGQVDAIVHLVASSIPDLLASRVSVVDEAGRLLSRKGDDAVSLSATQLEFRTQLEDKYRSRIEQLLVPVMGLGRVSAQVSVELDFSQLEETRESYAPDRSVLRSEQLSENRDPDAQPQGVPGALTNRVPGEGQGAGGQQDSLRSLQRTRNFEVDRTLSHRRSDPGRLQRISAAVLVDHLPVTDAEGQVTTEPLERAQLDEIEALVKDAIGFDQARGDTVSISNLSFMAPQDVETPEIPLWEQPAIRDLLRQLMGALVLLAIAFMVLRPALKSALKPQLQATTAGMPSPALAGGATPAAMAGEAEFEEEDETEAPKQATSMDKKLKLVRDAVQEDPKKVAQLMKQWVGDD